jgi:hypothetical protein
MMQPRSLAGVSRGDGAASAAKDIGHIEQPDQDTQSTCSKAYRLAAQARRWFD